MSVVREHPNAPARRRSTAVRLCADPTEVDADLLVARVLCGRAPYARRARSRACRGGQRPRVNYEEYHPFGSTAWWATKSGTQVSAKRYRYTGKEKDEETGLSYHGARYYAPWLGRWASADPAGMVDGPNRYAYVRGNPIGEWDPTGLGAEEEPAATEKAYHWQGPEQFPRYVGLGENRRQLFGGEPAVQDPGLTLPMGYQYRWGPKEALRSVAPRDGEGTLAYAWRGYTNMLGGYTGNQSGDAGGFPKIGEVFGGFGGPLSHEQRAAGARVGSGDAGLGDYFTLGTSMLPFSLGSKADDALDLAQASRGQDDILRLFHGTDDATADVLTTRGLDREAAEALGGGDVFWMSESLDTARVFAQVNPAGGAPAVAGTAIPRSAVESMVERRVMRFDDATGAWQVLDWDSFNDIVKLSKVE